MEKHLYEEHFALESMHWWFVSKKKIILSLLKDYLPKKDNLTILDAGCGAGLMLKDLEKYGVTSAMDFSEDAISFSQKLFNGEIKRGSLPDNIPFEGKKFDVIICLDVIEHIDDDLQSLKKLYEILNQDGVLVLTVPALMSLWSKWDDLNHHKRRYNRKQLEALIKKGGFEVQKLSYYNSILFPVVAIVRFLKNTLQGDSSKSDTDLPSAPINTILKFVFSLEKYFLKFLDFPIGVSLITIAQKKNKI